MIEEELIRVMNNDKEGELLDAFVDEFRMGGNKSYHDLLTLLYSNNEELSLFGAYIVNEINIDDTIYRDKIIDQLYVLISSEKPNIRFQALISIAPLIENKDIKKAKNFYLNIYENDSDIDVKELAKTFYDDNLIN